MTMTLDCFFSFISSLTLKSLYQCNPLKNYIANYLSFHYFIVFLQLFSLNISFSFLGSTLVVFLASSPSDRAFFSFMLCSVVIASSVGRENSSSPRLSAVSPSLEPCHGILNKACSMALSILLVISFILLEIIELLTVDYFCLWILCPRIRKPTVR